MTNLLRVEFIEKMEIRMGSPFNHCKLKTVGFTLLELGTGGFQDLFSWGNEFRYLALVKWNIGSDNEPGFNIFVLDTKFEKVIFSTPRISGICTSIQFENNELRYKIFNNEEKTHRIKKISL